jgi:hypothetical protein
MESSGGGYSPPDDFGNQLHRSLVERAQAATKML